LAFGGAAATRGHEIAGTLVPPEFQERGFGRAVGAPPSDERQARECKTLEHSLSSDFGSADLYLYRGLGIEAG